MAHIAPGIAGLYTPGLIRLRPGWTCFVVAHEWGHHLTLTVAGRQAADEPDVEHVADCIAELVGHPQVGSAPAGYGCTGPAQERAKVLLQGRNPYPQPPPRPPRYGGELHRVPRGGTVTVVPPAGYATCTTVTVKGAAGLDVRCAGTGIRVAAAPGAPGGMRVVDVEDAAGWTWSVTVAVVAVVEAG